jgi:carbon-monoxide dehydrogenase medium subunit
MTVLTAHPGLPEFDYIKPKTLAEASTFLAEHSKDARIFVGGTDVFVRMRDGFWKEKYLVDVKGLDGMKAISFDPKAGLTIGAAVNMNQITASPEVNQHYPLLAEAAHSVASYQLRTRATLSGNICNASPAGDTIGACIVFNGTLSVYSVNGLRREPLSTFFLGPGRTPLQPGDIVTTIHLPLPPKGAAGKYIKLGRNNIGDLAIVGVTALGWPDGETPSGFRFRIALASVAPTPLIPVEAEKILEGKPITEAVIAEAAEAAMNAAPPIDDVRGSARYRKLMVRNLTRQAVREVWSKISNQSPVISSQ